MQTEHLHHSIEIAVASGSIDDIACAVMAHPCSVLLPQEQIEDLDPQTLCNSRKLWDAVRFVAECEIAFSGGRGA